MLKIAEVANIDPNSADEQGASPDNKALWILSDPFKELVHNQNCQFCIFVPALRPGGSLAGGGGLIAC